MHIQVVHEPEFLGTAGTLLANSSFFDGASGLLIHADNLMADDLSGLLCAHAKRPTKCLLTMLSFLTDQPTSSGILEIDVRGVVIGFMKKLLILQVIVRMVLFML